MLQTLCDNEEIDIMPISIISNNLSILFGRCSWRALIIFVNESEKLGRVNTMVTAIEKVYFLQDMKSKVVQGTIMDLTIVLSRISAIKSLSFTDQKLLEVMVHILRSELSLECKCRATTILANLTMQNLGNLTMDNIVTALDAISDAMKETNKCTTDSELTKLLHQECWRLIFHLTTHPQSRQFIVQRQIVQRFLLTALLNEEACVHHNGLFAAEVLKTMSYDPATVDILIRNGRIIEILKKKARFEKDLRTRNVCLSALCQIVESKPAEFVQHPEILKFFSIAAINNNIMSHVSFEVKRSFCRIARESWPLLKGYSTMVNSLFAISRDFADARTILLEFASKESHRRAMVEEDEVLTQIYNLLQNPNLDSGRFGSHLLRLLSEDSSSEIHFCKHERLFGVLMRTIQTYNHPNRPMQLSCIDAVLSILESNPQKEKKNGRHSETMLKWVSIIPSLARHRVA